MSADNKKASELSAEELYALARQREKEEAERQEAERRKKREALMAKRKEMIARHRKELAELERQIRELGGRVGRAGGAGRGRSGTSISQKLCEIVASRPEMDVKQIKAEAEKAGLDTKNISQTLAYLKRQGRLTSPRRGVYKAA
ncbi:MAG: hypothetical protein ACQETK_12825 [Pseudomonadota bacterium]